MTSCRVDLDLAVPMRDGVLLRANVYRPAEGGPFPALLTRLPYGKDLALGTAVLDPIQATRRGYAVVVQDTRGRFQSEGEFEPYRTEDVDGFDTIAWAAAQPWSDGQVGMYGASYFGQTQWAAAGLNPPALKAIAPYITWSEPLDGPLARGGALEFGVAASWGLQMALNEVVRRHAGDPAALGQAVHAVIADYDGLASRGYWELPLKGFGPLARHGFPAGLDLALQALDEPAAGEHMRVKHEQVRVPSFNGGGWYDIFLQGTIDNHNAMRRLGLQSRLVIGPWSHSTSINPIGEVNFGFGAQSVLIDLRADFQAMQLRWFDHWLRGIDTGLMAEPPVKIFVMGINRWRDLEEFPPPGSLLREFFLQSDRRLATGVPATADPPDTFSYDPANPVPTRGGALLMTPEFRGGPYDQREVEARPDVLVYTSEPLTDPLEVIGQVSVVLVAASDAPSTDFVARLCDVHPDGRSYNLTDGIVRVSRRPGEARAYEIDLWATGNVFLPGHRIRLQVTSSCFPRWDRNLNTGATSESSAMVVANQTVLHDAAHRSVLRLPISP